MIKHIIITDVPEAADIIYYQLQDGFYVKAMSGTAILPFLTEYCNIPESYIAEKIKTIFHNGNPVDDIKTVKLYEGSVLAVSGAMPGIVGAMMRIGSPYAPMRESITEKGNEKKNAGESIYIKLKLFNSILKDHGERFAGEGVIFDKEIIKGIIMKCENASGKKFLLSIDNTIMASSETDKLNDEKYLISYS